MNVLNHLIFLPVLPPARGDVPSKVMTLLQASPRELTFRITLPVSHKEMALLELSVEEELEETHGIAWARNDGLYYPEKRFAVSVFTAYPWHFIPS